MRSYRNNPEGEANQTASKQHEREVFALKMQAINTKHTPGPWIAKEQYRDCVTNDVGHFVMWQDRSKPGVMLRRLDDKKGAFSAADARLIAAAPEMLDLLERIERSACLEQVNGSRCICFRCQAAELLAKINPVQA